MAIGKTGAILATLICTFVLPVLAEPSADAGSTTTYTEKDNGRAVVVKSGAVFEVHLSGNMTTGYSWTVNSISGKAIQKLGDVNYVKDDAAGRVGSGGTFVAQFKAAGAGKSLLKMAYKRPWEKGVKPAREFTIEVKVSDKAAVSAF